MASSPWHAVRAITVDNRAPDAGDRRQLLHLAGGDAARAHQVVHHVTLHLPRMPPMGSAGHHLWIGPQRIEQYHAVSQGISFRVHDAAELASMYGQPVRFVSDAGQTLDTGVRFPDLGGRLTRTVGGHWQQRYRP